MHCEGINWMVTCPLLRGLPDLEELRKDSNSGLSPSPGCRASHLYCHSMCVTAAPLLVRLGGTSEGFELGSQSEPGLPRVSVVRLKVVLTCIVCSM